MNRLQGRRGLVFGVANKRSIAWAIAQAAAAEGAQVGVSYFGERMKRRAMPLAESIDAPLCIDCDVSDDDQLDALFAHVEATFGQLDFVVHSLAFALRDDLLGRFKDTSRVGHALAMDVSSYSLVSISRRAAALMPDGGSILAMSYYGAEKVVPNYNVMGVAKAALEASVRYLAADLGPDRIRINAISAGPIKTLAAAGIPGFRDMLKHHAQTAPLRRNVTTADVAQSALFLLSDTGAAITGEVLHVDAGYNILANI